MLHDNPIKLTGYVTVCEHGVLSGFKLWYNPEIICNKNYWISLLNAHYHRIIWKDTRFYWNQKDTFVNWDGLAELRNLGREGLQFAIERIWAGSGFAKIKGKEIQGSCFSEKLEDPFLMLGFIFN